MAATTHHISIAARACSAVTVPAVIADAGEKASYRFLEFFAANIRNRSTRPAYARALSTLLSWCEKKHGGGLEGINSVVVAAYIERPGAGPRIKAQGQAAPGRYPDAFGFDGNRRRSPLQPGASVRP
jgi:hypothetical protein